MKRLTWQNYDMCQFCGEGACCEHYCDNTFPVCDDKAIYDRLAAYEDSGLEPEQAAFAKKIIEDAFSEKLEFTERLRELAQADREGRCVVLPAKTVFELVWCAGEGCDMVCPVSIDGKGCCDFCDHGTIVVEEVPCRQEHIERIGVDVFLTRTEAMAALRREQDG